MFIAISQRNDKNKHGNWIDSLENSYVEYLEDFGIKLIVIPNSTDVSHYFEDLPVEGVILSGGNDVKHELYGKEVDESMSISQKRDETERQMLEIAIEKRLPVLGICRGMQFINVYCGGKLRRINGHVALNHHVTMEKKRVEVNSFHGHGIHLSDLSIELRIFAQSYDNVVEGIYHPSLPIAGIQWHPERKSPDEKTNANIIKAFLNKQLFWRR